MGKDDRSSKPPSGALDPEDARLWRRVARSARPLSKGKNRAGGLPEPPREADEPSPPKAERPGPPAAPASPPEPPSPPPPAAFDRREARALAAGRAAIEARIDLHGHRQREAHVALKAFLARSRAGGHRHVLVITGKGGRGGEGPSAPGVLAREVPRWLNEPEFREMVVSFAPAHRRHGGEGALYVRLRRAKPS